MTRALPALVLLAGVAVACSSNEKGAPPPPSTSKLPPAIVAVVGALPIAAETVGGVSAAQERPPSDALQREIRDALFASAALAGGLDATPAARVALRGRLARARLELLAQEAESAEPTDAEVVDATARHFADLDRPEGYRVIHAVVRLPAKKDPAAAPRARAVAARLAERVATARDAEQFKAQAESTERDGFDLIVETLKPVAADGRVIDLEHASSEAQTYVLPFAQAASRLVEPGQKSPVVSTDFGFHVLMLLERTPPHTVPLEERRRLLRDEIITERARAQKAELVQRLRAATPPTVEHGVESLLTTVGAGHDTP